MEREISLSSFSVKNERGNRPGDFTTKFSNTLDLGESDGIWYIGFNKIISMAFTWTNINSGYRRIHADIIVYIFAHLHTALGTEGNMLDMN